MAFTETTRQGYFSRIGSAIGGVIFGGILIVVAFVVLFLNEGRAVHMARTLDEGEKVTIHVDSATINPANQGKAIHFTGKAINATGEKLADADFGISADAIHLRRKVSMYQWQEEKKTETHKDAVGGGETTTTTYDYIKVWKDSPTDSSNFNKPGHNNPRGESWRTKSKTINAAKVTVGAFTLDSALIGKINNYTPIELTEKSLDGLSDDLKKSAVFNGDSIYLANDPDDKPDPADAKIGDIKVAFEAALPDDVSIVAAQSGTGVAPFQTKHDPIELLYIGNHTAAEMFKQEQANNTMMTWIFRTCGFVAMWIGLALVLNPFKVLADVVGIIGDIVGAGIALFTGGIAIVLSFVTIAVAWISYRPVVGIGLLVVAGAAVVGLVVLKSKGNAQRKVAAA